MTAKKTPIPPTIPANVTAEEVSRVMQAMLAIHGPVPLAAVASVEPNVATSPAQSFALLRLSAGPLDLSDFPAWNGASGGNHRRHWERILDALVDKHLANRRKDRFELTAAGERHAAAVDPRRLRKTANGHQRKVG